MEQNKDVHQPATYDLHLHSYWSYDATVNPDHYFECARKLGLRCIAIADHHVLDSLQEVLSAAKNYPEIRTVPAAELTVTTSLGPVDLLCYGFLEQHLAGLAKVRQMYHDWQRAAGEAISKGMQVLGHDFSDSDRLQLLRSYRSPQAIELQGNTHVKYGVFKNYLLKRGAIAKPEEYGAFMSQVRKIGYSPPYPDVDKVVPTVKGAGALVAIAHPVGYFGGNDKMRMDALRDECGLDGIECAQPKIPPKYSALYRTYCTEHNLFSTGGSDSHSDAEADTAMARHGGKEEWLDEFLSRLDNRTRI